MTILGKRLSKAQLDALLDLDEGPVDEFRRVTGGHRRATLDALVSAGLATWHPYARLPSLSRPLSSPGRMAPAWKIRPKIQRLLRKLGEKQPEVPQKGVPA